MWLVAALALMIPTPGCLPTNASLGANDLCTESIGPVSWNYSCFKVVLKTLLVANFVGMPDEKMLTKMLAFIAACAILPPLYAARLNCLFARLGAIAKVGFYAFRSV